MNENTAISIDDDLLEATVKLNTLLFAGISGLMAGLFLLCITYVALYRGLRGPSEFLNLLGVFLPGYDVSAVGAWIGFVWGGWLGAVAGGLMYRIYARGIRRQVVDYVAGNVSPQSLEYVVLRIYGHPLGLALGGIAALGLLITTNLLAGRGAEEKIHAELLSHYLPGYSVSFPGGIIGAVEIFIIAYLLCRLLGAIYNHIVTVRQRGPRS